MNPSCDAIGTMERTRQFTGIRTIYRFFCPFCTNDHHIELNCMKTVEFSTVKYGAMMRMGVQPIFEAEFDNPMEPVLKVTEMCDELSSLYGLQSEFQLILDNAEEFFGTAIRVLN